MEIRCVNYLQWYLPCLSAHHWLLSVSHLLGLTRTAKLIMTGVMLMQSQMSNKMMTHFPVRTLQWLATLMFSLVNISSD
jgi:hypothetical protein